MKLLVEQHITVSFFQGSCHCTKAVTLPYMGVCVCYFSSEECEYHHDLNECSKFLAWWKNLLIMLPQAFFWSFYYDLTIMIMKNRVSAHETMLWKNHGFLVFLPDLWRVLNYAHDLLCQVLYDAKSNNNFPLSFFPSKVFFQESVFYVKTKQ